MKENLIHARTCVYNINYHVVWSVKYRRKILTREVEEYLKTLVFQIAEDKGFTVHLFEAGEGDHVHCFVSAPPKMSVTNIVKYLKGITGRKLSERFPEIRGKLWKGKDLSSIRTGITRNRHIKRTCGISPFHPRQPRKY
jgi:putative transposase